MQRGHDDLERRTVRVFGMVVDRNAAAVVGDAAKAVLLERYVDEAGVARHGFVHGIVDHLGEKVMQTGLVCASDIHAGPPPHRFQPFEHFDRRRRIAAFVGRPLARDRGQALAAAFLGAVVRRRRSGRGGTGKGRRVGSGEGPAGPRQREKIGIRLQGCGGAFRHRSGPLSSYGWERNRNIHRVIVA